MHALAAIGLDIELDVETYVSSCNDLSTQN